MIYYQHTALKPQFSQAFLNMAIKKEHIQGATDFSRTLPISEALLTYPARW